MTEAAFEHLDAATAFTGSVDVGVDATHCAEVSAFCLVDTDVSLGVSISFLDLEDVTGMVVNGGVSTGSLMGIDVPNETGGELSFVGVND